VHAHRDVEGADESIPYATHFTAHYPRTKALAEQRVRAAADASLRTVSLRPHLIWGPGDRHLLPRLASRANAGKLRQVGRRDVLTDTTYIDNCVDAHLCAAAALEAGKAVSGRAYFISDGAPVGLWTMARRMLSAVGARPIGAPVPAGVAYVAGAFLEGVHGFFGLEHEPAITRFAASQMSHAQWFDISAARKDLGYAPRVTLDEGLRRLAAGAGASP
jgi:nucleoside-diphosphate-sugar epimerase